MRNNFLFLVLCGPRAIGVSEAIKTLLYTKATLKPWSGWSITWKLIDMAGAMHLESILTTWNQAVKVYASVATLTYLKANWQISLKFVVLFWTRSNGHFLWGSFFWTSPTLSFSFLYQPPLVNLEKLLLTVQGFQSTSLEQIHFPKLFFYLYCMLYFFFFLLLEGYRAKTSWVFNPLVQFLYIRNHSNTHVLTHITLVFVTVCKKDEMQVIQCISEYLCFSDNMQINPILRVPGPYIVACQSHMILGKHHSQIELTGQSRDGSPEEEQMSPHCRRVSSWMLALSRIFF